MTSAIDRRSVLAAGAAALALGAVPARAQAKKKLRFSTVVTEQDIRAGAFKRFGEAIAGSFDFQPYFGGTLFKQGTELVAMQRGNLEMANLAPQDLSKQIPAWSIMTAAYLFRDAEHLRRTLRSDVGEEMAKLARDQLGVHILGPVYFGTRQVNLKPDKRIATPADMAGIKLRMPGGETWQFLGEALGASPTPVAYAEVYTALQTGAIDGQDNPLPNSRVMKFHEVTTQFVLTSHLVGYDLFAVSAKVWDEMNPAQRQGFQDAADAAIDWSTQKHLEQEKELIAFFRKEGLEVYEPDVAAFRAHAQKKYLESPFAADWPKGMLERINAIR
jgi:TRAP-type transport system periplasmic protein